MSSATTSREDAPQYTQSQLHYEAALSAMAQWTSLRALTGPTDPHSMKSIESEVLQISTLLSRVQALFNARSANPAAAVTPSNDMVFWYDAGCLSAATLGAAQIASHYLDTIKKMNDSIPSVHTPRALWDGHGFLRNNPLFLGGNHLKLRDIVESKEKLGMRWPGLLISIVKAIGDKKGEIQSLGEKLDIELRLDEQTGRWIWGHGDTAEGYSSDNRALRQWQAETLAYAHSPDEYLVPLHAGEPGDSANARADAGTNRESLCTAQTGVKSETASAAASVHVKTEEEDSEMQE